MLCLVTIAPESEGMFYALSGGVLISHCVPTVEVVGAPPQVSCLLWEFFVENRTAIEGWGGSQ